MSSLLTLDKQGYLLLLSLMEILESGFSFAYPDNLQSEREKRADNLYSSVTSPSAHKQ